MVIRKKEVAMSKLAQELLEVVSKNWPRETFTAIGTRAFPIHTEQWARKWLRMPIKDKQLRKQVFRAIFKKYPKLIKEFPKKAREAGVRAKQ